MDEPAPDAAPRRAGSVRMRLSDDEIDAKLRRGGASEGAPSDGGGPSGLGLEVLATIAALVVLALFVSA